MKTLATPNPLRLLRGLMSQANTRSNDKEILLLSGIAKSKCVEAKIITKAYTRAFVLNRTSISSTMSKVFNLIVKAATKSILPGTGFTAWIMRRTGLCNSSNYGLKFAVCCELGDQIPKGSWTLLHRYVTSLQTKADIAGIPVVLSVEPVDDTFAVNPSLEEVVPELVCKKLEKQRQHGANGNLYYSKFFKELSEFERRYYSYESGVYLKCYGIQVKFGALSFRETQSNISMSDILRTYKLFFILPQLCQMYLTLNRLKHKIRDAQVKDIIQSGGNCIYEPRL